MAIDIAELAKQAEAEDQAAQAAAKRAQQARLQLLEARRTANMGSLAQENTTLQALERMQIGVTARLAELKGTMPERIRAACEAEIDAYLRHEAPDTTRRAAIVEARQEAEHLGWLLQALAERSRIAAGRVATVEATVADPELLAKAPELCRRCPSMASCAGMNWSLRSPDGSCYGFGKLPYSRASGTP